MQKVLIIDFGGQYVQLIARAIREQNVYCEILPWFAPVEKMLGFAPDAFVFSGGPHSIYEEKAPKVDDAVFASGKPILGICYGMQYLAHHFGGVVKCAPSREYGKQTIKVRTSELFDGVPADSVCWMSHTDYIEKLPEGFEIVASTDTCPVAAMQRKSEKIYGVQFHPEVVHTQYGKRIISNFLFNICKLKKEWVVADIVKDAVNKIREKCGDGKVLCALSGGVDSAVAARSTRGRRQPHLRSR